MTSQEKTRLIRLGNQAFHERNMEKAAKIFKSINYQDGLIRLGDYFYFTEKKPLIAYGYYQKGNHEKMLQKLHENFVFALRCWLSDQ